MPNYIGRDFLIKKASTVLASVRAKTVTINGEPIDITTDNSAGYRTLLGEAATRSIDMSVEGLTDDDTLRAIILGAGGSLLLTDVTVDYPDGASLAGDFFLNSMEESGQHTDAVGFSASLQSSGTWSYTPA
jgi:predicted secreted protein